LALQMNLPPPTSTVFMLQMQAVALMSAPSEQTPPLPTGLVSLSSSRPQKPFSIGFSGATQLQPVCAMFCPSRQGAPGLVGWAHLPPGSTVSGAAQRQPLAVFWPSAHSGGPPPPPPTGAGAGVRLALHTNLPPPMSTVFMLQMQPVALMSAPSVQTPPLPMGLVSFSSSRPQKPFSIGFSGATQLQPVAAMF
jgi:hypothetical protein